MTRFVSACGAMDLRLGDWWDALANVTECDALITDPPYSARTHKGQRTGKKLDRATLDYFPVTPKTAGAIAVSWSPRVDQWAIIFCDHIALRWHETAWAERTWVAFAPVQWVKPDPTPRKCGDGPTCSCEQIMIARPPHWPKKMGSRPGHYIAPCAELRGSGIAGGKPLALMRALIRDYTSPGDLIIDPYAGSGTTLLAAAIEGRRAIGAEKDPKTFELAAKRLKRGYTPEMFEQK